MKRLRMVGVLLLLGVASSVTAAPATPAGAKKTPKQALQEFQDLIGSWRCTGEPAGTREERLKGFWQEKIAWQWQFKGADTWLLADFNKGKHFSRAELRYLPERDVYQLKATTLAKEVQTFEGQLVKRRLTVERSDAKSKRVERLVFSLLHSNRYLYRLESRPAEHTLFSSVYQVGATKEGVPFASEDGGPECIVSGGLGTMPVMHKSKTYYVCCSGCRDAFNEEPAKYVAEYEAKIKAKKKSE
jgi:Archaeal TRASH domain